MYPIMIKRENHAGAYDVRDCLEEVRAKDLVEETIRIANSLPQVCHGSVGLRGKVPIQEERVFVVAEVPSMELGGFVEAHQNLRIRN